jgi:hypothetical protein
MLLCDFDEDGLFARRSKQDDLFALASSKWQATHLPSYFR